jgi:hypothetical protein
MSEETKKQLSNFAAMLLAKWHLSGSSGSDLLHDAIRAVLAGLRPGRYGRHPQWKDLANDAAFSFYLRGVIASLVEAKTRRREHQHCHLSIQESYGNNDAEHVMTIAAASPEEDVAFRDLRSELFARLATRCPARLQPMLRKWEQVSAWSSKIPVEGFQRRDRVELRRLAKEICSELGVDWRG